MSNRKVSPRRSVRAIYVLFAACVPLALAAAPATATVSDRGTPVVYVGLETGFEGEGFVASGLRIIRLGAPPLAASALTADPSDSDPSISPNGRLVVFSRTVPTGPESSVSMLYLIHTDGTGLRRLTNGRSETGGGDFDPTFSPSGKRVLFVRRGNETAPSHERGDVCSIGVDGSSLRWLTSGPAAQDSGPALSPTGRQLVFSRAPSPDDFHHIYSARPNGSHLRDLTPRLRVRRGRGEFFFEATEPSLSPDGRTIALTLSANGVENIYTMRADGSHARSLTGSGKHPLSRRFRLSEPSFSPSGRSLLVSARDSYHSDIGQIYRVGGRWELKTPIRHGRSPDW